MGSKLGRLDGFQAWGWGRKRKPEKDGNGDYCSQFFPPHHIRLKAVHVTLLCDTVTVHM